MVAPVRDTRRAARTVAAVELGSNSFYLVVVRIDDRGARIVDRIRERIRLEPALDDDGRIRGETRRIALRCLRRFGDRLREFERDDIRAVGTHALRRANDAEFLEEGATALGHPIEVIDGVEEARLINRAVAACTANDHSERFVLDIGGGSTEFVHDREGSVVRAASVGIGCVSGTERFFPRGTCSKRRFEAAIEWARDALREHAEAFDPGEDGFPQAIGTAGTINAIQRILHAERLGSHEIRRRALRTLRKRFANAGHVLQVGLDGVSEERLAVLPGGIAVLIAAFDAFDIESMRALPTGLREGLIHDLADRDHRECAVEHSVRQLISRFGIDVAQADRVAATAEALRTHVAEAWGLESADARRLLTCASRLHEIGLCLSHTAYHRHGEYLVLNSAVTGLTSYDRSCVAALIRHHRRKLASAEFPAHPTVSRRQLLRLCCLLRLAVILNRSRADGGTNGQIRGDGNYLGVSLPADREAALMTEDLNSEVRYLASAGLELEFEFDWSN